ncbi:MAG: hypothetical protein ACK4R7_05815 [Fervidobacterium sp.]
MSTLELLITLIVFTFIIYSVCVNFHKLLDLDFSYYYFETAVYSGLWKGYSVKEYDGGMCNIMFLGYNYYFKRFSDNSLNKLSVKSFENAKSGTYKNSITIEPIFFEVRLLKLGGR